MANIHATSVPCKSTDRHAAPAFAHPSQAAFDQLVRDYYGAWFQFHPEAAVEVGVAGYAGRLTPYHDDDIGALVSLIENVLGALDELTPSDLDPDRQLDFQVLYGAALLELHELMEADWRYRDPARILPVNAIYQLTVFPVSDVASALQQRLLAVPGHLRGARRILAEAPELVPEAWLEGALAESEAGAQFLRQLPGHAAVVRAYSSNGRIAQAAEEAARALDNFAAFLRRVVGPRAQGQFACGRDHFERVLKHRHFLDCDATTLHDFGARLFERTRRELIDVTRRLRGDDDVRALANAIRAQHPRSEDLLSAYRKQMLAAYEFVRAHDLVTIPAGQRLQVVETPAFLRHAIPFAAYLPPAVSDPGQCGRYYVSLAEHEALLGEHNHASLMHTCVHEAWPGHHLQFVTANQHAASSTLPRLLNPSSTLFEGWALYCEQLMHEQGFLGRPEQEFVLLRDRLWRALRVQLDVELQTRGLSLAGAAQRLVDALGFPLEQAKADVLWYSRAPGVPMGYATGWALINRARDRLLRKPAATDLRGFHDQLLAGGSVALKLVLARYHGAEFAQAVEADVLAS